jgi:DNA-binding NtrC family response regulator
LLLAHPWPGNVRELKHAMESALVEAEGTSLGASHLSGTLRAEFPEAVPDAGRAMEPFKERVQRYEKQLLLEALVSSGWNQSAAARALQMPLRTLTYKMRSYGIGRRAETPAASDSH